MTHVGGSRRANGDETHRQRLADDTTLYRNGWVGGALDRANGFSLFLIDSQGPTIGGDGAFAW